MAGALEDIRVLDFTRVFAGPFCTLHLAELGAEVIKVEIPQGGDSIRYDPPRTKGGEGGIFVDLNRGKKSITLNLTSDKGRQICRRLAQRVDVLVENFSPRVMGKLGLTYEDLSPLNPGLVYASLSGFGHTGPYSARPAYDPIAQAMGGFMTLTGAPDGPPQLAGIALGDYVPGLYTAIAILAALHHRGCTGQGQYIDISMQDCVFHTTAVEKMPRYYLAGEKPARQGNRSQVYRARDGHLIISVGNIGQWNNFLRVIEREDLIGVEKYSTWNQREAHFDELLPIIEHWTTERDVGDIVAILSDAHLPCSPIPSYEEALSDRQLASRDMYVEVEQVVSGKVRVPGSPFKLSATPGNPTRPAPFLGEHNFEVYSELLGFGEEELTALADEGIV
ncbi:MAG: CoA transferase [Chloroflexota bacterium]|nr:CoA transferase [Chloroflexota bacterium]